MRAAAVERLIYRNGVPVTVRRKVGTLDPVTSTRAGVKELEVTTVGVRPQSAQRSAKGDPLSTQDAYYLVPLSPFADAFTPADGDLVIDDSSESRILMVRTKNIRGRDVAYQLFVSGVRTV